MPARSAGNEGFRLVQLPPVRIAGTAFGTLLDEDGRPIGPERLQQRRDLLLATLHDVRPEVVITELFPFGRRVLADEFMALVSAARDVRPRPRIFASIRDILVAPSKASRVAEAHERLRALYDGVLVHGDPDLVPLEASWPVDDSIRRLLRYTGYVDEGDAADSPIQQRGSEIVVSGGSSASSLPLYRAAVEAARVLRDRPWRILCGAGLSEEVFAELRRAAPPYAAVERARPDFRALLGRAALSVSQAGYNTVLDLLRSGAPAVLVPFEAGRETEQRLRAEKLAERGLARVLPEADLTPASLMAAVAAGLRQKPASAASIRIDGADRSVALIEETASRAPPPRGQSRSVWWRLDEALAKGRASGRQIAFWWRDDDAVAHTPALDRLIALSQALDIPVALAAIPTRIEPSLVGRIEDERLVDVLVHGLTHTNYAPRSEKKAEFGAHRPLAALIADARAALELAQERMGEKLLPVFVPPWNRIVPALAQALPELGYAAVSAFAGRHPAEFIPGLRRIDTHIDPVDWHGSRSRREPAELIETIARVIESRLADPGSDEPIGFLTHHLVHDEAIWSFCQEFLSRLTAQGDVQFAAMGAMVRPSWVVRHRTTAGYNDYPSGAPRC
jgi:predicted glycosyltransferase